MEDEIKNIKKKKKSLSFGILSILIILLGSTYAFFTYSKSSEAFVLTSNSIKATFTSGTNSVTFSNAYPISDEYAIANLDKLTYIDFTVAGDVSGEGVGIAYEIYLTDDANNTLDSNYVKVYLTDDTNNKITSPTTYNSLDYTTYINDPDGKLVYGKVSTGTFSETYRLYVWLDSTYEQNTVSQNFKFEVNLYAYNVYIDIKHYKEIESSMLTAGGEYYAYNTDKQPAIFGNMESVDLNTLINNQYIENVYDQDGNSCDLENSFVKAYKDSSDTTNYIACLVCGNYVSNNKGCSDEIDYSLKMTASINDTSTIYNENSYINGYVTLTFNTFNDIKDVIVLDNNGTNKTCTLETKNDVNTCQVTIDTSGEYEVYGVGENGNETDKQSIAIKIDNQNPTFDIYDNDDNLISNTTIRIGIVKGTSAVLNKVLNISDTESLVKNIRYSFEEEGTTNYIDIQNNLTEFNINKALGFGTYKLIVEVEDNAGNKETKYVSYEIYYDENAATTYCANFYLNGAEEIDGLASNKTNVCCVAEVGGSCTITSPTITPKTDYEVLGWSDSSANTTITANALDESGNPASITLFEDRDLYAITISSDSTVQSYLVEFDLNGADAYSIQGVNYTESSTFICRTDHSYNGADIPTTCTFALPSITRSGGTVYGWDTESNNYGTPAYASDEIITINSDLYLNAITSRTVTLSYDANGGSTTLSTEEVKIYNTDEYGVVTIPDYVYDTSTGKGNMCRAGNSSGYDVNGYKKYDSKVYTSYKYLGLGLTKTTVSYCPGDSIPISEDTTLHAVWKKMYGTGKTTGNVNNRTGPGTGFAKTGSAVGPGKTVVIMDSVKKSGTGESNIWYLVQYGSQTGYSSGKYITPQTYPPDNSCKRTDYTCTTTATTADVTVSPSEVALNITSGTGNLTSTKVDIDSQCGNVTSVTVGDSSLITADVNGNITAKDGSVAVGSKATTTVTYKTAYTCSTTINVTVKNIDETPPTVNISISGTAYENGYKSGAKVTATCSSEQGIDSFTISNNKSKTFTVTGDSYTKTATATYSGSTSGWTITAKCTGINGITSTATKTYKIYEYSQSSACGVSSYSYSGTCKCYSTASNTALTTKSCSSSVYSYGSCSGYCSGAAGLPKATGSCTRTAIYKKCYHT